MAVNQSKNQSGSRSASPTQQSVRNHDFSRSRDACESCHDCHVMMPRFAVMTHSRDMTAMT
eukprot:11213049-Lingulodinium_polyedra.AAC.1